MAHDEEYDEEHQKKCEEAVWDLGQAIMETDSFLDRCMRLVDELDAADSSFTPHGTLHGELLKQFEAIKLPTADELATMAVMQGEKLKKDSLT